MSLQHMTEETQSRAAAIATGRQFNLKDPDIANRTKVVRLIVVPDDVKPGDANAVRAFALRRQATRVDVFVVKAVDGEHKGNWVPMSWLGGALVEHDKAHHDHVESVLVLMVLDREQVQWESDVPFKVVSIQAKEHGGFPSTGNRKAMPFDPSVIGRLGGPGRPVISGPPALDPQPYDQLFKVSFSMDLPGSGWTDVDPDIYCDWV